MRCGKPAGSIRCLDHMLCMYFNFIFTQVHNLITCLLELLFMKSQEYHLLQALGQAREMIYNGMFLYNACLLGTVIPTFYEPLYGGKNDYRMWIMLGVISTLRSA